MENQETYYNCVTCDCADVVLEKYMHSLPYEVSQHRVKGQSVKCGFGLQGVCCKLCANGPCRITSDAPRGVCGMDADTIVAKGFLRTIACGTACFIHILENAATNLKKYALAGEELPGNAVLERLAKMLDIPQSDDSKKMAIEISDWILADLYKPSYVKMELLEKIAFPKRYARWKAYEILPGGAKSEALDAMIKTSTNLSSDPEDMLIHAMRLGIVAGCYGLVLTSLMNDVLMGQPTVKTTTTGLQVIDPDYINIMMIGHQHSLFKKLLAVMKKEGPAIAQKVGAKGFKMIGCTCVGQEMQMRSELYEDIFSGYAGNNFSSELILSTGAVDGVVTEFNCTLPGVEPLCKELKIKEICLDDLAKKRSDELIKYRFETAEEDSVAILEKVAEAYQARRGNVPIHIPEHGSCDSMAGFSEVSLKSYLGDSWNSILDAIKVGKIKGIVCVASCSNVAYGYDTLSVGMTKELLKRDILVFTSGCSAGALANCGLTGMQAVEFAGEGLKRFCNDLSIAPVVNFGPCMSLGRLELLAGELAKELDIDLSQLPMAISTAQWLEEQSLADFVYGLTLGFTVHLGVSPFISGSKVVMEALTTEMQELTGGQMILEKDALLAAQKLEAVLEEKRKALNS